MSSENPPELTESKSDKRKAKIAAGVLMALVLGGGLGAKAIFGEPDSHPQGNFTDCGTGKLEDYKHIGPKGSNMLEAQNINGPKACVNEYDRVTGLQNGSLHAAEDFSINPSNVPYQHKNDDGTTTWRMDINSTGAINQSSRFIEVTDHFVQEFNTDQQLHQK